MYRGPRREVGPIGSIYRVTISGRGRILAESPSRRPIGRIGEEYAIFGEDGQFLEKRHLGILEASFVKDTEDYWGDRDGKLVLLDEQDRELRRLDRRPDRRFWNPMKLAAGTGRELVVLEGHLLVYYDDRNPSGRMVWRPVLERTWEVAHGGRWIVIDGRGFQDLLFDTHRGEFHRIELSGEFPESSSPDLGFSADGTELWAVESSELTLHRYALP